MPSGIWRYRWVTAVFNDLTENQRATILSHVGSYSLNDLRRTESSFIRRWALPISPLPTSNFTSSYISVYFK